MVSSVVTVLVATIGLLTPLVPSPRDRQSKPTHGELDPGLVGSVFTIVEGDTG